jgi:Cu(I)/Ag(I) efflux system membrane fusion protein
MLDDYFKLKEGFVQSKDNTIAPAVNASATALIASADSVKLKELKADTSIIATAQSYTQGISSEAKALVAEPNLENKRKSFQMISDQLYDLIRTVRYDGQVVYHSFCPMAFNDQGAYWLDRTSDIKNPYFGAKMLSCGEVLDSLDFTPKQK